MHPEFGGRGFGRILMRFVLSALKKDGYERVELTSNKYMSGFYEKLGFKMVGAETVQWENMSFTEYRMYKLLSSHSS